MENGYEGSNHLGKLLMKLRTEIREHERNNRRLNVIGNDGDMKNKNGNRKRSVDVVDDNECAENEMDLTD